MFLNLVPNVEQQTAIKPEFPLVFLFALDAECQGSRCTDGNGRVARMMPSAMLLGMLDTLGLWSVSRGLARQVKRYKDHLAACDTPKRNDLDGRGALSEQELAVFAEFFLETCIDQISSMENLMRPDRLRLTE